MTGVARLSSAEESEGAAASDPKALAIADKVMEALGGKDAWDQTRFLRFDFAVEKDGKPQVSRSHTWDKWTGRYRLEGKTKEGDAYLVLTNVNSKEGSAYLKGERLKGEDEAKYLKQAYGIWVNDAYWLTMPYKLRDPGVILTYAGNEKGGQEAWDKIALSFDNVGLTPKDKYWAYVNEKTHLVDKWEYILKGGSGPATAFLWKGWRRYGKVMLAPERVNVKDNVRIWFPVLVAPDTVSDARFTSP